MTLLNRIIDEGSTPFECLQDHELPKPEVEAHSPVPSGRFLQTTLPGVQWPGPLAPDAHRPDDRALDHNSKPSAGRGDILKAHPPHTHTFFAFLVGEAGRRAERVFFFFFASFPAKDRKKMGRSRPALPHAGPRPLSASSTATCVPAPPLWARTACKKEKKGLDASQQPPPRARHPLPSPPPTTPLTHSLSHQPAAAAIHSSDTLAPTPSSRAFSASASSFFRPVLMTTGCFSA